MLSSPSPRGALGALLLLLPLVAVSAFAQAPAAPPNPSATTPKPAAMPAKPAPTPPPVLGPGGVKRIPQPGVAIPEADRAELTAGVAALGKEIASLRTALQSRPAQLALLPDVLIFHKAVDWALRYDEFFDVKQVAVARAQLALGQARAKELREGKPSWLTAKGLVPRGYLSKIDGSVQPYGMVIPDDWQPGEKTARRLDFWAHGRGEKLSELDFINQRLTQKGEFNPPGAFTLHLYGRFCCANKFAGEVDLFEALESARQTYNIDPNKLVMRGFSMGGAAVWQFGTHFAGMWAAVQPGAGFADTKEFMRLGTGDKPLPPAWEQTLWRWYDSTSYAANLSNTKTVAYSGEIDGQKLASDAMIRAARVEAGNATPPAAEPGKVAPGDGSPSAGEARVTGLAPDVEFYHVIGPQTPHKIKPEAKPEIDVLVDDAIARHEATPKKVKLVTYSLIYPRMEWITITGMEKQWERAEVEAEVGEDRVLQIKTRNVTDLQIGGGPAIILPPLQPLKALSTGCVKVIIDGQTVFVAEPGRHGSGFQARRIDGVWRLGLHIGGGAIRKPVDPSIPAPPRAEPLATQNGLTKRIGLCGPIDHAFMSSFIFVRPTGKPLNDKVGAWVKSELEHATEFWRRVFRGEAPVKDDTAITAADIANSNLILWGDPSSNAVLRHILALKNPTAGTPLLPLLWNEKQLGLVPSPTKLLDPAQAVPVLIFPNPLNPAKYVVLNSGPTFREQALLNNADQTAKLPDWAIIDLNTPPDAKWPGEVKAAGFFDEQWKMPKP